MSEPPKADPAVPAKRVRRGFAMDGRVVLCLVGCCCCAGLAACAVTCKPTGSLMFEVRRQVTGGVLGLSCDMGFRDDGTND